MKIKYKLIGLNCENCAKKIENDVSKINGYDNVSISLSTGLLTFDTDIKSESMLDEIVKIVKTYEPHVDVVDSRNREHNHEHDHKHEHSDNNLKIIIVGASIYILGILLSIFGNFSEFINIGILVIAYVILGYDVLLQAIKNIGKGQVFDENFLMGISTIGAFIIGEYQEAVGVMLFYQVGEYFQGLAVSASRKSITELMDIKPEFATVKRNGELLVVSPEDVLVSELIVVKPGENIPLDGIIVDGNTMLDTKALTGESVPREVMAGDEVLSGCINQNGVITIEVTKTFENSQVMKILDLVENSSSKKAKAENFITIFAKYYTPTIVILAAIMAIVPPILFQEPFTQWVRRSFVFLVISCPCALVISIPLTFFGGIGSLSKKGVLVKGGNYLEALYNVDTIVFDKTGTLTKGVFNVHQIDEANNFSADEILYYCANGEFYSNHPIAKSILEKYNSTNGNSKKIEESNIRNYEQLSGLGISAIVDNKQILVGNDKLMEQNNISYVKKDTIGTKVFLSVDGIFAGCINISDELKDDSISAIKKLKEYGIKKIVMLTGDNEKIAKKVASELGITKLYYELLPEQKVEKLEEIKKQSIKGKKVAFVGDGINDAPVLALSDVGISMGALGQDAAIEASDIVLMTDEPTRIVDALYISKATRYIVMQNIIFALSVKGVFLIMGVFGYATMWEAVISDVGVMLVAILNTTRILKK